MRSSQLALEQYDSDKAASGGSLEQYDPILEPWLGKRIVLLELGIGNGGSLLLWRDYFPLGTIVGVDTHLPKAFRPTERIHLYEGSQIDLEFLSRVGNGIAPDGFDIIIDDASHVGELSKTTFWYLFEKHLKSGGLYAIEDWGTGYWDDWPDGKKLDPDKGVGKNGPLTQRTSARAHGHSRAHRRCRAPVRPLARPGRLGNSFSLGGLGSGGRSGGGRNDDVGNYLLTAA